MIDKSIKYILSLPRCNKQIIIYPVVTLGQMIDKSIEYILSLLRCYKQIIIVGNYKLSKH
jgi:hypothetical protein